MADRATFLASGRRRLHAVLREHPLIVTLGACYLVWRLWHTLDELFEGEEPQAPPCLEPKNSIGCSRARAPSFNLTNERGDLRERPLPVATLQRP